MNLERYLEQEEILKVHRKRLFAERGRLQHLKYEEENAKSEVMRQTKLLLDLEHKLKQLEERQEKLKVVSAGEA